MLSLRGKSGAKDVAIHRVSGEADGFVYSLTGTQWIATGFALAMTRWWSDTRYKPVTTRFCHCEERAERRTRQSIVSRGRRTSLSARVLVHSGSPRAFSPRDDKIGKEWECAVRFQHDLCHCEERAERETWQSIVSRGRRTGLSIRSLVHSGSPRASALAMTRCERDLSQG